MRQVVTGRDEHGKSIVVSEADVHEDETGRPIGWIADVWGSEEIVQLPTDGARPAYENFFPAPGGFRFKVVAFGPDHLVAQRTEGKGFVMHPNRAAHARYEEGGMHSTDTIDIGYVLEGEIHCELDDGVEIHLTPGDVIVQNGTRHRWLNRSDRDCKMVFAIIGAHGPA